jgi:uncharacterized repeat protein (TIGR01451 family)
VTQGERNQAAWSTSCIRRAGATGPGGPVRLTTSLGAALLLALGQGPALASVEILVDLSVNKTDSPDPVTVGQDLVYTVTVINNSGLDEGDSVDLTDTLPPTVTFVSVTVNAQQPPRATCNGLATTKTGTEGNDPNLRGTPSADVIHGLGGKWPHLRCQNGDDVICGSDGNDSIEGGRGGDQLFGEAGDDRLFGNDGRDELDGGEGQQDQCNGGDPSTGDSAINCEVITNVP